MTDVADPASTPKGPASDGFRVARDDRFAPAALGDGTFDLYRSGGKRAFDIFAVLASLLLVAPLLLILALVVSTDGGAPFFRQKRVGRDGRIFTILKLRTMVPCAEQVLEQVLARDPALAQEWNKKQKLRHDPRVTRIGAFLRRTSLDELPQLWNVLAGHMSLVGPRPMMPQQRDIYPGAAYYSLRPGITGLWQVSERNGDGFVRRVEYDEHYASVMSLRLDVAVLAKTLVVVMRGTGW